MIEVAVLLKETPYSDVGRWFGEYETYNNPLILEAQLDKIYYTDYWIKAHKNPDCDKIRDLIGTEADMRNLQLILSTKYMKLDPRLVQMMAIALGHKLRRSLVKRLATGDVQGISSAVLWPSYSELLRSAVELVNEGRPVEMETLFSRYTYSHVEEIALRNPNTLAYLFSYLSLCLREARNLTTLAIGRQMKLSEKSMRSLLV
jgi:vacuolar-type H+-ATPase subunit C/Vma6